jgi:predicted TIM-barrel fold metal-dependent hydrolase
MEIVDAQIHDLLPAVAWEYGEESKVALVCELMLATMDAVGVEAAIVAPGRDSVTDAAASTRYPDRLARVVHVDHSSPEVDDLVSHVLNEPSVVAVRQVVVDYRNDNADELRAGVFEALFAAAERHRVPLFVLGPGFPGDLAPVAETHPDLTLIIDHLGLRQYPPLSMDHDPWEKLPALLDLARYPGVNVKLCGAELLSRESYPFEGAWPYLHQVLEAFGPSRLLWASDFTRLRMVSPGERSWLYSDALHFIRDTTELSPNDKTLILGANTRRLLSWPAVDSPKNS